MTTGVERVGQKVRQLREKASLTRPQLAEMSGVSQSAIARLERGEITPTIWALERIAGALGLEFAIDFKPAAVPGDSGQPHYESDLDPSETRDIKVFVADSQLLVAQSLSMALDGVQEMHVVYLDSESGLASTGLEAADAVLKMAPDVAVIDFWMPVMDGPAATQMILASAPRTKVLLLSWILGPREAQRGLAAGAAGVLPKNIDISVLITAIRRAARGESPVYLDELAALMDKISERQAHADELQERFKSVTPREIDVLRLLSYGRSSKDVAQALGITGGTLRIHLRNILNKTQTTSRMEAVALAREAGLFQT